MAKEKALKQTFTPREGRKRTMTQIHRQAQVFEMSVFGDKTYREIAQELGISAVTVVSDMKAEAELRAAGLAQMRGSEQARHLALVERHFIESMALKSIPGTGALGAAAKSLEMRAKVLGLDAPTKIDIGIAGLLEALEADLPE